MTPTIRDVAEDAFAYIEGPSIEFDRSEEVVLRNVPNPHPLFGMVLRPRLRDVDGALARARRWFADRGRSSYTWLVSDASEPRNLVDRLLAAGAQPDELDPVYAGMVLDREPARVDGVDVRKVTTFEEQAAGHEVAWRSFGFSEEQKAELRATARERWESTRGWDGGDGFQAVVGGEVVGTGGAAYLPCGVYLLGGNVAEEHRGRGIYRALVRARWDEAVRRGTPALLVQAGAMSKPVLERIGFRQLCEVQALVDSTS